MKRNPCVWLGIGVLGVAAVASIASAIGPDVIVGDIPAVGRWGVIDGVGGYSVASTACNIGDTHAVWIASSTLHPVIAQNLYRVYSVNSVKRFEQIGQGFLKHGFVAGSGSLCATCDGTGGGFLGVGCSDTYSTTENGDQIRNGPRSEVNPYTGVFSYPYVIGWNQTGSPLYKRNQIPNFLLTSATTVYAEANYICPDEAPFGNQFNNCSYRKFQPGSFSATMGWAFTAVQATQREKPAILAWQAEDPLVTVVTINVPGDGRMYLGYRVSNNGNGTWHYEYALQNVNSHRGVQSFGVPVGVATLLTGLEFHDIDCHSGEPFSNVDWMPSGAGVRTWASETFAQNPNANALRWGSMYNFRFDANLPPKNGNITLGLFRPGAMGDPTSLSVAASVPDAPAPPACPADVNADQQVNGADLSVLLSQFGQNIPPGTGADVNHDGVVNGADLSVLLGVFGTIC